MRSGDRILGVAEITGTLGPSGELQRWSARDTRDGSAVIVASPGGMARLRPSAAERFAQAHQDRPEHAAMLPCLLQGAADGKSLAVLPEHEPYPDLPLEPPQALALLDWLLDAVLIAAPALGGELEASDLVQLPGGQILLSPSGVMRDRSLARLPIHLPPEADPERPLPSPESALYGLGVLVFRAITGEVPVQARTMDQLKAGQQSPRSLRQLRPEISEELDTLVSGLLSPSPAERLAHARSRPTRSTAPQLPRVHRGANVQSGSRQQLERTYTHQSMALKKWTVLLLPPPPNRAALRRMAGLTDLFASRMTEALDAGLPVPLGSFTDRSEAHALLDRVRENDASLVVAYTGHKSRSAWVLAGSSVGGAGATGALLTGGALLGLSGIGLGLCVVSGGFSGIGLWLHARRMKSIRAGMRQGHARLKLPDELIAVRGSLIEARKAIHAEDLPELIALELGASLDALQDELERLFDLDGPDLKREPARGRLNQIDLAARSIRDATQSASSGTAHDIGLTAIQRAAAAAAALKSD